MAAKPRRYLILAVLCLCQMFLTACSQNNNNATPTATPETLGLVYRTIAPPAVTSISEPTPTPNSTSLPVATVPPLPELPTPDPTSKSSVFSFKSSGLLADITAGEVYPEMIDRWLVRYRSPHTQEAPSGKTIGQVYIEMGHKYGINPAYAVAFFTKESQCGTAGSNLASFNFGNIRWSQGYYTKDGVWRAYTNWTEGMEDWFKLIRTEYVGKGLRTVDQIVPVYAPPFENNTELYIKQIKQWAREVGGK